MIWFLRKKEGVRGVGDLFVYFADCPKLAANLSCIQTFIPTVRFYCFYYFFFIQFFLFSFIVLKVGAVITRLILSRGTTEDNP